MVLEDHDSSALLGWNVEYRNPIKGDVAVSWIEQPSNQFQSSGLSATGWSKKADHFPGIDFKGKIPYSQFIAESLGQGMEDNGSHLERPLDDIAFTRFTYCIAPPNNLEAA